MNKYHSEILEAIKSLSGKPTQHTLLDSYLGNSHPKYPINNPTLRSIAREWSRSHRQLSATEFQKVLDSLIHGKSSTEKCMSGILLDVCAKDQRKFNPNCFDEWLNQLVGWVEIDTLCTGAYSKIELPDNWKVWNKLLLKFSKSKNISKRRASLVLLCSPMRKVADERLAKVALANIDRLKHEKEILITKAISWLLRSMVKHYRKDVEKYLNENNESLPRIAVRETLTVLTTGKKTKSKT